MKDNNYKAYEYCENIKPLEGYTMFDQAGVSLEEIGVWI